MKNIKLSVFGIMALIFGFSHYFLNATNTYGIQNMEKLDVNILAQTCSTYPGSESGSDSGDYAYLEKLTVVSRYGYVATFNSGLEVVYQTFPVGLDVGASIKYDWIYDYLDCNGPSISRCDQSKVGQIVRERKPGGTT